MNSLDEHLIHREPEPETVADLVWWEVRRPYYNLFLLFMIGLMVWQLLPMARNFGLGQVAFWSVLYVLSANVFTALASCCRY